ncbi:MAG TPA: nuclear transport factor 2 family protein [Gaiellaceae bacterium]|nr:nuclear transport factor 2 family protein [Gaiellaceae bacterium]
MRHVEAFKAHDLDGLHACFASNATWVTGTNRSQGKIYCEGSARA